MLEHYQPLLSEQLRPHSLQDIILPAAIRPPLDKIIKTKVPINMIFYGRPGIGKTSVARILLKELEADVYELNGSFNNGEKTMVRGIEQFAHTVSLSGHPKICFIDEADQISKSNQEALRYIIENTSSNTRFLMTANIIGNLTPAIRSRCCPICFDPKPTEALKLVDALTERYMSKLETLGVRMEVQRIREIIGMSYPDMRLIANKIELEAI